MKRSIWSIVAGAALVGALVPAAALAQNQPVVAVWYYDNNSVGANRADFDGLGKGIADLLITDLAANPRMRIVERGRIQQILEEQNLARTGMVDEQTAVRLGRLLGACYSIYGGFMNINGQMVLTGRTVHIESGRVGNPQKIQARGDDVLGMISQLSEKLNADLNLSGCPSGAARSGDASPAQQGGAARPDAAKPASPAVVTYAKPMGKSEQTTKLDVRSAVLYGKALDAIDAKDTKAAIALLDQVLARRPDFAQAKEHKAALQSGS